MSLWRFFQLVQVVWGSGRWVATRSTLWPQKVSWVTGATATTKICHFPCDFRRTVLGLLFMILFWRGAVKTKSWSKSASRFLHRRTRCPLAIGRTISSDCMSIRTTNGALDWVLSSSRSVEIYMGVISKKHEQKSDYSECVNKRQQRRKSRSYNVRPLGRLRVLLARFCRTKTYLNRNLKKILFLLLN